MASTRLKIKSFLKDNNTKLKEDATNPPSETHNLPAPGPNSEDTKTSSLAANNPVPTTDILKTPEQSNISLWDRAYDSLKARDKKLVEEYERLLSRELRTIANSNIIHDNNDEFHVHTENQIENDNHKMRLTQLETITSHGLQQLDKKKAKFNIFGHEFVLRDQLAQATQFIQTIKDAIDVAVRASPEASLAWAGFCVILPLFMNPSTAEEASRDGYLYVTSRIHFYVKLESLLSASNRLRTSGLDVELEGCLITLYRLIIDFQIRTVRRVYLTRLKRLKEDTVQHENWKGMIAKVQESERLLSDDFRLVNDATMGTALEELNSNAEKLLTQIDTLLSSLIKTSGDGSTIHFQNVGAGYQFTNYGGRQYNATDNARQFNGAVFQGGTTFY
ncbi:hypothetical protein HDV63DRAFT_95707 [Trichoderma sp. SZMC 28014]